MFVAEQVAHSGFLEHFLWKPVIADTMRTVRMNWTIEFVVKTGEQWAETHYKDL